MEQNNSEELKKEIIEKFENINPIGNLFDVINYSSYENLDKFIVNMSEEQALYCIIEAVKCSYRRGVFNIEESEAISKSLRIISSK
jgi:phosphoribosyl-dephospho-CoA transferase